MLNSRLLPTVSPTTDHSYRNVDQLLIAGLLVFAGFGFELIGGISAIVPVVLVTIPMWLPVVARTSLALALLVTGAAVVPAGLILAQSTAADRTIDSLVQRQNIIHFVGGLAIVIVVLWGRSLLSLPIVVAAFAGGMLADAAVNSTLSFKYDLAVPVTIFAVGLVGERRPVIAAGTLCGLGLVAALDDGRSVFAFCVLAACIVLWQSIQSTEYRSKWWTPLLLLTAISGALYLLFIQLLTAGYLGEAAQQRTVEQLQRSGSLIAGGRPELGATIELMRARPFGYGWGAVPDTNDLLLVQQGFAAVNVDADNYIKNYMLGGQFRLHSVAADLWANGGLLGLLLAVLIGYAIVTSLSRLLADRRCPPVVAFTSLLALWYLAFGPIFSNWPDVCFAVGLVLLTDRSDEGATSAPVRDAAHGV